MMKYRQYIATVILAAIAVVTVASCSDSYPGLEYTGNDISLSTNESMDKTPIMVFINEQNFFSVSATRSGDGEEGQEYGTGPFTDLENVKYKNSLFYVFAFRGQEFTQGNLTGRPVDLSKSRFSSQGSDDNVADCLVDGKNDYRYGAWAKLTQDYPGAFKLGEELGETDGNLISKEYYYGYSDQRLGYNFFAFHIDNLDKTAATEPHRNQDQIYYDIEIDGTQDIMCGYAPRLTREKLDGRDLKLNEEEKNTILNESDGLYSTFSAHRNINPEIDLTHQLTRLNFSLYPGDDRAGDIVIEEISVKAQTRGKLVVATRNPHSGSTDAGTAVGYYPYGDKKDVILRDTPKENGGNCPEMDWNAYPITWNTKFKDNIYDKDNEIPVGSSIMVPEADIYDITLKFHQKERDADGNLTGRYIGGDAPLTVTYENIHPTSSGFLRGYIYKISIAVYGLQPIKVDAFIHEWKPGDDVHVGDEDDEIRQ